MERDADGFYSRLGFAYIGENVLAVEYKFAYTSSGGLAQRSFTIPMTEETIVELIKTLESKLTASAFAKEQRTLMTSKLRDFIKARDNYTCCFCGNSTYAEPNLLLEIDHIIPVSKGGLPRKAIYRPYAGNVTAQRAIKFCEMFLPKIKSLMAEKLKTSFPVLSADIRIWVTVWVSAISVKMD